MAYVLVQSPPPPLRVVDLWVILLVAATVGREHNQTVLDAYDDEAQAPGGGDPPDAQDVTERLARTLCPSGLVGLVGWQWSAEEGTWIVIGDQDVTSADSFLELGDLLDERKAALDPNDPAHVALVARVCAVRMGVHVGGVCPIPVSIRTDAAEGGRAHGVWVRFYQTTDSRGGGPLNVGQFIRGAQGEAHGGELVFRVARKLVEEADRILEEESDEESEEEAPAAEV